MTKAATPQAIAATITLDMPLTRGETEITELRLRKPTSGELRGVSLADVLQMQTDALITLIPRLSTPSLTATEVRQMDPADLVQCGGEIAGFLLTKRTKGDVKPHALLHHFHPPRDCTLRKNCSGSEIDGEDAFRKYRSSGNARSCRSCVVVGIPGSGVRACDDFRCRSSYSFLSTGCR